MLKKPDLEIKNINTELSKNINIHEKIAVWISNKTGSMYFIYFTCAIMVLWISINVGFLLAGHKTFDAPYTFPILLFISSIIQLLVPLFILVSQNIQNKRDKALADQEYLIAKRTEEETKLMFEYLRNLNEQLKMLFSKFNTQQQKIMGLEEKQSEFNDMISKNLILMLQTMINQIKTRPCLLEETSKEKELHEKLIEILEKYRAENDKN